MISDHISDIITATKENPNGVWRNKTLSALQTALAAAKMMENGNIPGENSIAPKRPLNSLRTQISNDGKCTCLEGSLSKTCPIHGHMVAL